MKSYPICLIGLEKQNSVVVGGGKVAARKTAALLQAGAQVTVISPEFCAEFGRLAELYPTLQQEQRLFQSGDLASAWVVVAATDSPAVNHQVWEEACAQRCLVNVVDDPAHSNFILPAVVQRGELSIAVSTGGSSPALARRLRERLETQFGPEYGVLAALLAELRPELAAKFPSGEARLQAALRLVDSDLIDIIRCQGLEFARRRAVQLLEEPS